MLTYDEWRDEVLENEAQALLENVYFPDWAIMYLENEQEKLAKHGYTQENIENLCCWSDFISEARPWDTFWDDPSGIIIPVGEFTVPVDSVPGEVLPEVWEREYIEGNTIYITLYAITFKIVPIEEEGK